MSQSLSGVYLHIIFSTKDRFPFLSDERIRGEIHTYLGGIARSLECPAVLIGGVSDHVHILVRLDRKVSQSDLVKELKRGSTRWIRDCYPELQKFAWQSGYGAFSVSASHLGKVSEYIAKQAEHHAQVSFEDEYRAFLKKHGLEYDERYVWD